MKKITTILLAAAFLAALTGCSGSNTEISDNSQSTTDTSHNSSEISDTSGEISDNTSGDSEVLSGDSTPEKVPTFKLSYARPCFKSTVGTNIKMSDEEKDDFFYGDIESLPKAERFEVKVGDKLPNGLVVVSIEKPEQSYDDAIVCKLEGELTMEGVIHLESEDHDYIFRARDMQFYPNTNQDSYIPTGTGEFCCIMFFNEDGPVYVRYDGNEFDLGSIDNTDIIDEQEIFGNDEAVNVRITLKNIRIGFEKVQSLPVAAEIVDIERID